MKYDEEQLWNAVLKRWQTVKDFPIGTGERIVSAWNLGEDLGIPLKRIMYLANKWHKQGKWVKLSTMTGTDIVSS